MPEPKVRCPYCPQALAVSQLHRHVSAFHHGKDPDAEGKPIDKPKHKRREKDIPGQLVLFEVEKAPED